MRVQFPKWPVWNYHFAERDIRDVTAVNYIDAQGQNQTLDEELWRFTTGRSGVCGIVFLDKPNLPKTAERPDAVTIEYEP